MPTSEEPIIVRIVREAGGSPVAEGAPGGGGGASLVGGAAKLSGMFNVLQAISNMVGNAVNGIMKPLNSILSGTLKLLGQFLRPAIDILVVSMMPLFTMLKPLVKVFNDIMRPFREIAMRMIKSNPMAMAGPANVVLLQGLATALVNVVGEFIKVGIGMFLGVFKNMILYPLADLLPWFDREGVDVAVAGVQDMVTRGVNTVLDGLNKTSLTVAKNIATGLGVMVDDIDFSSSMKKAKTRLQASINDLFDVSMNQTRPKVSLSREDRYNVLENTMNIKREFKKYGVEYSEKAGGAAEALQKLRAGVRG